MSEEREEVIVGEREGTDWIGWNMRPGYREHAIYAGRRHKTYIYK